MHRLALLLLPTVVVPAHEPITTKLTWTQEISRIFYKRCAGCHHEGGSAPFSLMTYDETRPWAKAIREEVLERRMPPWGAVKGFGEFRDDPSLSLLEIEMIVNWVEGGAPKGDDIYLPRLPRFEEILKPAADDKLKEVWVESKAAWTMMADASAVSIRPRHAPDGRMVVIALRPDGGVEPLIWLRNYREEWKRTYVLREPLWLPKGTRVVVSAGSAIIGFLVRTSQ